MVWFAEAVSGSVSGPLSWGLAGRDCPGLRRLVVAPGLLMTGGSHQDLQVKINITKVAMKYISH